MAKRGSECASLRKLDHAPYQIVGSHAHAPLGMRQCAPAPAHSHAILYIDDPDPLVVHVLHRRCQFNFKLLDIGVWVNQLLAQTSFPAKLREA